MEIDPKMIVSPLRMKNLDREPSHTFIHFIPISSINTGIKMEKMPNQLFIIVSAMIAPPAPVQLSMVIAGSLTISV